MTKCSDCPKIRFIVTGEQCREQRKRCLRSWPSKSCDRCSKRNISCSFEQESRFNIFLDDIEDKETLNIAKDILQTLSSLQDDIAQCERQIALPQPPIQHQHIMNKCGSIDKGWQIIIKNSPHQQMKLEIHIERTADLLDLVNTSYVRLLGKTPRNLTDRRPEPLQAIRVEKRYFHTAIIRVVREAAEIETSTMPFNDAMRSLNVFTTYPSLMLSLADEFFQCRNLQSPIIHREYYNCHRNTTIGKHLNVAIGCMMSIRGCNHSHLTSLPQDMLIELRNYYIAAGTGLVQDMMMMENPPLSFCILLLCLASANMHLQKMRKAWLLACPARTYLQQHMSKYIDPSSPPHSPSSPEIETYKFALHFCYKLEYRLGSILNASPTPEILNLDPVFTLPTKLDGDNEVEFLAFREQLSWDRVVAAKNKWLASHESINGSVKSVDWKAVNKVTNEFYHWYLRLPVPLQIGEKPFDIDFMDIPKDKSVCVCLLQMAYYGEWMIVYSNFLSLKNISEDEEMLVQSKKFAFLASRAIIKLAHHVSLTAFCRIEFFWILFACEPLLYLLNANDKYVVEESRNSLKIAKDLLRVLLASNTPETSIHAAELGHYYNATYQIAENIAKEVSAMFSSYGLQF